MNTTKKREARLAAAAARGAAYDSGPFLAASADARYQLYLDYAVGSIEADDTGSLAVAFSELLAILRPHAAGMPDETLRKLLAGWLTYLVERRRGSAAGDAVTQALAFRPRQYRLSAASAVSVDLQGKLSGMGSNRDLEVAREFLELLNPPQVGRPAGADMTLEKWECEYAKALADVKREGRRPTQKALATSMGLPESTFKDYKRRFRS